MAHLFQSMPALLSVVGQINVKKGKLEPDKHYCSPQRHQIIKHRNATLWTQVKPPIMVKPLRLTTYVTRYLSFRHFPFIPQNDYWFPLPKYLYDMYFFK